jgi:hypothetical protein
MRTNGTTITGHRSAEDALRHGGAALLVDRFLTLLAEGDVDQAVDLLAEDVDYTNVSLPTIRGRETVCAPRWGGVPRPSRSTPTTWAPPATSC